MSLLLRICTASAMFACMALSADLNGTYTGRWDSDVDTQAGGDLTMRFSHEGDAVKTDVSFIQGNDSVKCDVKSVKFDGSKLLLVMEYRLGGGRSQLAVDGILQGKTLSGTYKSKSLEGSGPEDSGTWKVHSN